MTAADPCTGEPRVAPKMALPKARCARCGATVDRFSTALVCRLPREHDGSHNTADDGTGDVFENRGER